MKIIIPKYRVVSRNKTTRHHWTAYNKEKDSVVSLIRCYAKKQTYTHPVCITITAYFEGKKHIDVSNIDDKIYVDAVRYAGIIADDNYFYNPMVIKKCVINAGEDSVEVEIHEIGEDRDHQQEC